MPRDVLQILLGIFLGMTLPLAIGALVLWFWDYAGHL